MTKADCTEMAVTIRQANSQAGRENSAAVFDSVAINRLADLCQDRCVSFDRIAWKNYIRGLCDTRGNPL